mgnify:CR=1 FL=1
MKKEGFFDRLLKACEKRAQEQLENDPYYQDLKNQYKED